ncbi:MAG TPA: molybdenum cofactor biosynthesis protein MoaE [Bryobacteraceae bacterium]|nr:molybdenum cofactor biosynthesis protein MoaE [Bryobacteraceae bacterium]
MTIVRVKVLFFGMLKDIVGRAEDHIELADGAHVDAVFARYASDFPRLTDLESSIVLACNQEFCDRSAAVREGDEIAFLPPVSGGTSGESFDGTGRYTHEIHDTETGCFFALTRETIDTSAIARQLLRGEDGAVVDFEGVVRNNTKGRATKFLDYECYEPMAVKMMAEIGREILAAYAIGRIAMVHRLGRLQIGEASVAIVVTAPHRKPAFEAALEGINRLKRLVPIWKKEHFADGEVWVEGEWDESVLKK